MGLLLVLKIILRARARGGNGIQKEITLEEIRLLTYRNIPNFYSVVRGKNWISRYQLWFIAGMFKMTRSTLHEDAKYCG